jgi:hypothetical protein
MKLSIQALLVCLLVVWSGRVACGQPAAASVRGQVLDPSGAAIPGAMVTLTGAGGDVRVATTNGEGRYQFDGLAPGKYAVRAMAKGFALFEQKELAVSGPTVLDIELLVTLEKQQVTVSDQARIDVDPSQNAGALVLKGTDLDALSDNPDDLASDLQALAGPSAGPNGGQIYIDGFTGGRLPPKESIREVRINQNPFSAEYDRLGFGRIEILTKPGSDRFHGQAFLNFGDSMFNSRNPYSLTKPPYQQKFFGGNLSGRLTKKSSFFVDAERRDIDEVSVVNALTLDSSFNVTPFSTSLLNPTTRTTVSPRIDYQLSANHTLVGRYTWTDTSRINEGVGVFSLPSRAYNMDSTEHTVQVTETAVLNTRAVNETRFQFIGRRNDQMGDNSQPTVQVLDAFTGGGSNIGLAYTHENRYELQNYTTLTANRHLIKFGARLRGVTQSDRSTQNYNGTFTFTSLEAYRITLLGLANGLTMDQIRHAGGGPSQFSLTAGNPLASVGQYDAALFVQDDWRVRPNFSLSLGLRYETQNHIGDHADFAPRFGFAWGVGRGSGPMRQPKTVIRGGFGMFYDRFSEDLTLQAIRLDGVRQQQYVVPFPNFYPVFPDPAELQAARLPQAVRRIDSSLRAPYVIQSAISVERQLPRNMSLALTYADTRGVHTLRSRNINAPLPGTYDPHNPSSAVRPYGNIGDIYDFESTGLFKQSQLITSFNGRVTRNISFFGFHMLNTAHSNTDGAATFPANSYDLSSEWGPASFAVRQRFLIGGSLGTKFGIRLNPFVMAATGAPFNITVGRDLNGDSQYTDRPAFATDLSRPSVVRTPYGVFDTAPLPGQTIIPRNYGVGPGQFTVNLRLSKTFGFGPKTETAAPSEGPMMRGGMRGIGGPRGGPGGGRGGPGGGRGGPGGMFGEGSSGHRYSLIFSASARNLLNSVNPAPPIGNLSSPLFGQSNSLGGGFGASSTANRRIEFQLRFMF